LGRAPDLHQTGGSGLGDNEKDQQFGNRLTHRECHGARSNAGEAKRNQASSQLLQLPLYFLVKPIERLVVGLQLHGLSILGPKKQHALPVQIRLDLNVVSSDPKRIIRVSHGRLPCECLGQSST
jgi:hypothetical protein